MNFNIISTIIAGILIMLFPILVILSRKIKNKELKLITALIPILAMSIIIIEFFVDLINLLIEKDMLWFMFFYA